MNLPDRVQPSVIHKVTAAVLLAASVALGAQAVTIASISDDDIINIGRFALKKQGVSEEVFDQRVGVARAEIVRLVREQVWKPLLVKGLMVALFLGIAAGLLTGRRRPTRLLAGIAGAFGMLAFGAGLSQGFSDELEAAKLAGRAMYTIDLVWFTLLPIAAMLCLVIALRVTWRLATPVGSTPA